MPAWISRPPTGGELPPEQRTLAFISNGKLREEIEKYTLNLTKKVSLNTDFIN